MQHHIQNAETNSATQNEGAIIINDDESKHEDADVPQQKYPEATDEPKHQLHKHHRTKIKERSLNMKIQERLHPHK